MRLIFFGLDDFAIPTLISLIHREHEIAGVVPVNGAERLTSHAKRPGNPLCRVAEEYGLSCINLAEVDSAESLGRLKLLKADLGIVVAAFVLRLPGPLSEAFPSGCIGVYPSLLPMDCGPAPITQAILRKETRTGVSAFRLTDEPNSDPLLVQRETMIRPGETLPELSFRLSRMACDALDASLAILEKNSGGKATRPNKSETI